MDAQVNFQYTGCLIMIFGVEKLILDKKLENVIGPSYFTVKLSVYKTTLDMFRTIWAFKTRELVMNDCFTIQRYQGPRNSGAEGARAPPLFCSNHVSNKRSEKNVKKNKCN